MGDQRGIVDIIWFYNQEFLPKCKPVLVQLRYQSNAAISSISTKKNLISSPVKQLLGKNVIILGDRTNKLNNQTPLTLALQAYHQSPLLKQRRIKNLANYVDGKRLLQKKSEFSKQQTMKQTSMLINQRWRSAKSPQSKMAAIKKTSNTNSDNQQNM